MGFPRLDFLTLCRARGRWLGAGLVCLPAVNQASDLSTIPATLQRVNILSTLKTGGTRKRGGGWEREGGKERDLEEGRF